MKVKTTYIFTIECELDECIACTIDLTPEDKDHECEWLKCTIEDGLTWPKNYILYNMDCTREEVT